MVADLAVLAAGDELKEGRKAFETQYQAADALHRLEVDLFMVCYSVPQEPEMRIKEDIKPVTYMKARAAELLRTVDETRRPVVITQNGEPKGVLLDVTSYQELRDATLLLKLIAQGEEDIRQKRTIPQEDVFRDLRARLAEK